MNKLPLALEAVNSIKDILGDLKRDYGLNLLDEWETNPQTDIRYKKYYK